MNKMMKVLIIILAILVFSVLIVFFLYQNNIIFKKNVAKPEPQKQETQKSAETKKYENKKFSFSVDIPKGWEDKEEENFITFSSSDDKTSNVSIEIAKESLEGRLERGAFPIPLRNYKKEEIYLKGEKAYKVTAEYLIEATDNTEKYDKEMTSTFIANGDNVYVVSGYSLLEETYNNILNSISFK